MRTKELSDDDAANILALLFNTKDCPVCAPAFADDECLVCGGEGYVWIEPGALDDQEGTP